MLRASRPQEEGQARGEVRATIERLAVSGRPLPQNAPGEDEVRRIPGTQLYLGRMYYRVHGLGVPFLWFALERVAGSASR